jgi:GWxTD domain-containing protein
MKKGGTLLLLFILCTLFRSSLIPSSQKPDDWDKWLKEVRLIMTRAESAVFKTLGTEEDKKRFQQSFWKIRDPRPDTPENEYMMEFYERRKYAEKYFRGDSSDRGRIYILLGEPAEKKNFSGSDKVVECELWTYRSEGRPNLPPYMYLLFFRQGDVGDYRLFYPGIHTALDIITPFAASTIESRLDAFEALKRAFPELAYATLSVIPGDTDPSFPSSASSSNYVFSQIFSLPEREIDKSYLKDFASVEGLVDVAYSFKEIAGKGNVSISENRGFRFLNYAIMPDVIHPPKIAENVRSLSITLNLRVEDLKGKTIFQRERNIDLPLEDVRKLEREDQKAVFEDFAPIIEGEFDVNVAFTNKSTDEFFVYKERINVAGSIPQVMLGFRGEEVPSDNFLPFSAGNFKLFSDPRFIFSPNAFLEGVIFSEEMPGVSLINTENKQELLEIRDIVKRENHFAFKHPLSNVKAGNYYLSVSDGKSEVYRKIISVLPFDVKKPLVLWKNEPASSGVAYTYEIAQEHLNHGDADSAIEYFNRLPKSSWNASTLPVIARAYYLKKEYEKVISLLEQNDVEKNYSVLLLLANSSLELKRLPRAAEYFELLRKYGDTVELNNALGAIYYSLGEKEKAKIYWDRAKSLEMKIKKKG